MTSDDEPKQRPLVLVGLPRGGTTWTMRVLAWSPALIPQAEPDNESKSAPAVWAKASIGHLPVLRADDDAREFASLWAWVFAGAPSSFRLSLAAHVLRGARSAERRRFHQGRWAPIMQMAGALAGRPPTTRLVLTPRQRVFVKSVHMPLALDWLVANWDVDVVVLFRHPANVFSSWLALDLNSQFARLEDRPAIAARLEPDGDLPPPGRSPLERIAWTIGLLSLGLEESVARHPEWIVRTHEQLCEAPEAQFRCLYDDLGLEWNSEASAYLERNDQPGAGFLTRRVASEQPDAWRTKLDDVQLRVLREVVARFPLTRWGPSDYDR